MFLPVAEKMGLLDYLAPRRRNRKNSKAKKEKKNEPDAEKEEVEDDAVGTDEKPPEPPQRSKEEVEARARGHFVKKQKVRYLHKATDTWHDAVIVGVHFDDGPDKPYYTIKYPRHEVHADEDGNEAVVSVEMEKQTTPDRLEYVD